MPVFNYQARTKDGQVQSGRVEAANEATASQILQRHGLIVITLEAVSRGSGYAMNIKFFDRVGAKDLAIFSRQLSILFSADVPLIDGLHTLAEQSKNTKLHDVLGEISADIDSGTAFSAALGKHEDVFSNFYVQMVRGGEAAGKLSEVLDSLAEHTEREFHTMSRLRGALIYPAFVFSSFIVAGSGMMIFILPQLVETLLQSGAELPLLTRAIIGISDFMRNFWYLALFMGFGTPLGIWWLITKTEEGRELWSRVQLRIPVLGELFRRVYIYRFAESLGMLSGGGVPISESLKITADIMGNGIYKEIILETRRKVIRGERISTTLAEHPEIPGMVTQMISVGEKAGKLSSVLENLSSFYRKEIDTMVDTLTALIEPILILSMGLGVGLLVAGIMLPIYSTIGQL